MKLNDQKAPTKWISEKILVENSFRLGQVKKEIILFSS